jgi:hypothetical protein
MTEFIDYLIRKELTLKIPNQPFRTKSYNSNLKFFPEIRSSKNHVKVINSQAI